MITLKNNNIFNQNLGGILNGFSEKSLQKFCTKSQRLVSHVFKNKSKPGYAFLGLPDDKKLMASIKKFTADQKRHQWENIVVLGIGGSALGLIAIQESILSSLHNLNGTPRLFVVDNIDPTHTYELFKTLNLKKTLFVVISKSGSTVEPMVLYGIARELLEKKFLGSWQQHMVFITDPKGGLLGPIAKKEGINAFSVPPKVGGRFSVLSAVGLLPAALAGADIGRLLQGAHKMREELQKTKGHKNLALNLAASQYLLDRRRKKSMTVLFPYSNALFRMSDWYRQLLAESIGKNKRTGPTPINALGTTDQHSQLQLYNQGPNNKFFIFLRVLKPKFDVTVNDALPKAIDFLNGKKLSTILEAAYRGTASTLAKNGRPNITLTLEKIDETNIGALFMLFEFQVTLLGLLYKVNAFDQPGVEESKALTKKILASG
jgi:glucose-6-phosphate isomerase